MDANGQRLLERYNEKVSELRGMNRACKAEIYVLTERLHKQSTRNSIYAVAGFIIGVMLGIGFTVLLMRK